MSKITETLENLNENLSGPHIRNLCLRQAEIEFEAGNICESVFYQTEALCLGYRCKYLLSNNPLESTQTPYEVLIKDTSKKPYLDSPLLQYATKTTEFEVKNESKSEELLIDMNPEKGIKALRDFCSSLPNEWTVLQLCKGFNANSSCSLKSEIVTDNKPIYLTILKNTQSHLYPDPICIKINMDHDDVDIFSLIKKISNKLLDSTQSSSQTGRTKYDNVQYNQNLQSTQMDIKLAIETLRTLIGPWRCLFSGPATSACRHTEKKMHDRVNAFATANKLDKRQYILLSTLACQAHLLSSNDIKLACSELTDNPEQSRKIKMFLRELRQNIIIPMDSLPCILIVDELLDQFYWETMYDQQELCRISSFHLLKKLYTKYADKISDGYLKLAIDKSTWLLTDDPSLALMGRRISSFLKFWKPKTECTTDRNPPSVSSMTKCLQESDLYIYSGHGSGLQFFSGRKITNLNSNSVILLLGCDSVRLKSSGLHSEMIGAHLFYFATKCPAVLGTILLAFDRQLDLLAADILTWWIPSENQVHWSFIDKTVWVDKCQIQKSRNSPNTPQNYEPRLLKIACALRQRAQTYHSRVYFVYRGLPVWNTNAE